MIGHLPRMARNGEIARLGCVGLQSIEITIERGLGVDHQGPPPRHAHNGVRPLKPAFGAVAGLGLEIDMLGHAAEFEHLAQLHLAPASACFGCAQRLHQLAGLA